MKAFIGATLIDGSGGRPRAGAAILVDRDRISAIGDGSMSIPADAEIIRADGKYIIPGLMDANVHLVLDYWPLTLVRYERRYDELAVEAAQIALKNGVTTVFDTWGPREYLKKAQDQINDGRCDGARIFFAGNIVGLGGPFSDDFLPSGKLLDAFPSSINQIWQEEVGPELVWMSPSQVAKIIKGYSTKVDFIKYAVTTHCGEQKHLMFSPRVQRAIVEEARKAGLTVQTHSTTNEGLHLAIDAGADLLQHVDLTFGDIPLTQELLEELAESRIAAALLPQTESALGWYKAHVAQTPWLSRYQTMDQNARAVIKSGAVIAMSTDAGIFSSNTLQSKDWKAWQPNEGGLLHLGEGHFNWLLAVQEKGMSAMDALMAATINVARGYKVDRDLGTVEKGKLADFLILSQNPLLDAKNYRSISSVVKNGKLVDLDGLPHIKHLTASHTDGGAAGISRLPCSLAH